MDAADRNVLRVVALAASLCVAGCANGDFWRVRPGLVGDGIHDWVGQTAAASAGLPVSVFPLTEDERLLRDIAFQLIEPAYDRNRWYSILNEYGVSRVFGRDWCYYNIAAYDAYLWALPVRSASVRYARLNDAVRNDVVRIPQFASVARRVVDMDSKRAKSLEFTSPISPFEIANARARVAENALVISWVQQSLVNRAATYGFALERLAIATPEQMAADVDRSITLLKTTAAENRIIPGPDIVPGPIVHIAPYPSPPPAFGRRVASAAAVR